MSLRYKTLHFETLLLEREAYTRSFHNTLVQGSHYLKNFSTCLHFHYTKCVSKMSPQLSPHPSRFPQLLNARFDKSRAEKSLQSCSRDYRILSPQLSRTYLTLVKSMMKRNWDFDGSIKSLVLPWHSNRNKWSFKDMFFCSIYTCIQPLYRKKKKTTHFKNGPKWLIRDHIQRFGFK